MLAPFDAVLAPFDAVLLALCARTIWCCARIIWCCALIIMCSHHSMLWLLLLNMCRAFCFCHNFQHGRPSRSTKEDWNFIEWNWIKLNKTALNKIAKLPAWDSKYLGPSGKSRSHHEVDTVTQLQLMSSSFCSFAMCNLWGLQFIRWWKFSTLCYVLRGKLWKRGPEFRVRNTVSYGLASL